MNNDNESHEESSHNGDYYINRYSCGVISGFTKDMPLEQNKANTKILVSTLNQKGYSVARMQGSFIEPDDPDYSDIISLFVVNQKVSGDDGGKLEQDLIDLGQRYGQECIMSIREGTPFIVGIPKIEDIKLKYGEKICLGTAQFGNVSGKHVFKVKGRPFGFK